MAKLFACRLSLIAFATCAIRGVMIGSDFESAVQTALIAAAALYVTGYLLGELARRLIEESVQAELAPLQADITSSNKSQSSHL